MRNVSLIATLLLCASVNAATLGDVYIQENACPFEGCTFGDWPVKKLATVYSEPSKTSKQIGALVPGAKAKALTGEVHVVPGVAEIVGKPYKTTKDLDPKALVYILDPVGEGRTRVYQNEVFYITKIATSNSDCEKYNDPYRCWVRILKEPKMSWWVKVETTAGTGWVLMEDGILEPIDRFA